MVNKYLEKFYEMAVMMPGEFDFTKNGMLDKYIKEYNSKDYIISNGIIIDKEIILKNNIKLNLLVTRYKDNYFIINKSNNEFIGFIDISPNQIISRLIRSKYKNMLVISGLYIKDEYKNKGIMKYIFQYLINSGFQIVTDGTDYENSRKLILSLNGISNYRLDIIDDRNKPNYIIIPDVKLKDIYDGRLWKYFSDNPPTSIIGYQEIVKEMLRRAIIYKRN